MKKSELKSMVRQVVEEVATEVTLTTSSTKTWVNAKGQTMWEVKVYNPDPVKGANIANYLNAQMIRLHRPEEKTPDPERIEYPPFLEKTERSTTQGEPTPTSTDDVIDVGASPGSPADVRRDADKESPPAADDNDPDFD